MTCIAFLHSYSSFLKPSKRRVAPVQILPLLSPASVKAPSSPQASHLTSLKTCAYTAHQNDNDGFQPTIIVSVSALCVACVGVFTLGAPEMASASMSMNDPPAGRSVASFMKSRQLSNGATLLLKPLRTQNEQLKAALEESMMEARDVDYQEVLRRIRAASMRCIVPSDGFEGRRSLTTAVDLFGRGNLEYRLGDPCVLRMILKNATMLNDDMDVDVEEGREHMDALLRSLQLAEDYAEQAGENDSLHVRERLVRSLQEALLHSQNFSEVIQRALCKDV